MSQRLFVFITTQFEGVHRWENAPDVHAYLRNYHRHMFHVRLYVPVTHDNRDVEFIALKREVDRYLKATLPQRFEFSCEQIAAKLLARFNAKSVEVSEDGENGAIIIDTEEK